MNHRSRLWLVGLAALVMVLVAPVRAAGTVTVAHRAIGNIRTITATITADAANGSVPDTVLPKFEGRILAIETNPGTTAPTDNYDITIEDAHGFDVLLGVGANRDTTTTERAAVLVTSSSVFSVVDEVDVLTLKVANNSVNSAQIVLVIYYASGG